MADVNSDIVRKLFSIRWNSADVESGLKPGTFDGIKVIFTILKDDRAEFRIVNIGAFKDVIEKWLERMFKDVNIIESSDMEILVSIPVASIYGSFSLTEAAIPAFKADPKTGKIKRVYKCVGGPKHGRKVSNPLTCDRNPDLEKRRRMRTTIMKKRASMALKRNLTRKMNVGVKRASAANKRLKRAYKV